MPLWVPQPLPLLPSDVDRFWSKVDVNGPLPPEGVPGGPCWNWLGGFFKAGYGQFALGRMPRKAHRVSYTINIGDVPNAMPLDHLCKNKGCCNPLHTEPVTYRENAVRCDSEVGKNSRKTHCKSGHALEGDNVFYYKPTPDRPHGRRYCRVCRRESEARLKHTEVTIARMNRKKANRKSRCSS